MVGHAKLNATRRGAAVGVTVLPAEGRKGRTPVWPLDPEPSPGERRMWVRLWKTPQAYAWGQLGGIEFAAARYVRLVCAPSETVRGSVITQISGMEDRLGLTPRSMKQMLWVIDSTELAARTRAPVPVSEPAASRAAGLEASGF